MYGQTAIRSRVDAANDGSRTLTLDPTESSLDADSSSDAPEAGPSTAGVLRLRGATSRQTRVQWDEEVVDNEGLGRKSSKSMSCLQLVFGLLC